MRRVIVYVGLAVLVAALANAAHAASGAAYHDQPAGSTMMVASGRVAGR